MGVLISSQARRYGQCDMEIDFKKRVAEPTADRRGDIARTYFYMSKKYNIKISSSQKKLFNAWNKQDPESGWEKKRNKMIAVINNESNQRLVYLQAAD